VDEGDPRQRRHAQTKARILREAWKLATRDGVAGISLGDLAKRVGLRQPSLYTYFASKSDLYDEMFADGNEKLWSQVAEREYPDDPCLALAEVARAIVAFCAADVARFHLMFQRPVPGFEPSARSFALAERFYGWFRTVAARAGIIRDEDLDVVTALIAGLSDQQVSNDRGGERWLALTGQVVEMLLVYLRERGPFTRPAPAARER
jgi:AcrR family transcriptional regulator